MQERADFRNGKYEGGMSGQQRHGLGIFIDDDLTFYISHWQRNHINGLSLIYISHGKYIYGEWKDNEPHGLTVFRSGDTVLVGNCTRGKPTGKCLVIFERFNFACVLQEGKEWSVVASGQLISYDTLLEFIELIGTPVPDYYFSLTKFACNFSKHSQHIKTLPCFGGCCYFGYENGLALVFNAANGLVSVGLHHEEQVGEFGGHFQGIRWAEEGNFQRGGEKVRYSGERPVSKIYSIFQKLHKRSMEFHNEYFDSKVKYFTCIEELLRSQLHIITQECRKDKQLRHVDLSQSFDFQEYTQEESIKITCNRDHIYQPPASAKSKQDEKPKQEEKSKLNYFRKPEKTARQTARELKQSQLSNISRQKEEPKTPKSSLKGKESNAPLSSFSMLRKSPIKETSEFAPDSHKKSTPYLHPDIQNQREDASKELVENPPTPSKLRDRMKSNNLRYINGVQLEGQQQEEKREKIPVATKTNNIYREIRSKKEEPHTPSKVIQNSDEYENYQVPNFKPTNEAERRAQPQHSAAKQSNQKSAYIPQLETPELKEASPLKMPRKSTDVSSLSKPSYEDIEERRKRILKEYRDLNHQPPKVAENKKLESPCNNIVFSLPKEEQSSFGFMPITITDKPGQQNLKRNNKAEPSFNRPKEGLLERQTNTEHVQAGREEMRYEKSVKYGNYVENDKAANVSNSAKPGGTPARVRKNYQYLYE